MEFDKEFFHGHLKINLSLHAIFILEMYISEESWLFFLNLNLFFEMRIAFCHDQQNLYLEN